MFAAREQSRREALVVGGLKVPRLSALGGRFTRGFPLRLLSCFCTFTRLYLLVVLTRLAFIPTARPNLGLCSRAK